VSCITSSDEAEDDVPEKRGRGRPRKIITREQIDAELPKIATLPADEFEEKFREYSQILLTMTMQETFKKLSTASPTNLSAMLKTLSEMKPPSLPMPKAGKKVDGVTREEMLRQLGGVLGDSKAPNYVGLVSVVHTSRPAGVDSADATKDTPLPDLQSSSQ
jgi:hypothetical protein